MSNDSDNLVRNLEDDIDSLRREVQGREHVRRMITWFRPVNGKERRWRNVFCGPTIGYIERERKGINRARYLIHPRMDKTYYYLSKRCIEEWV